MLNAAMPHLNKYERKKAFTVLLARVTQQKVATVFGVQQSTVQRINVRLHQLGSADDRPRSGRPQITIDSQIGPSYPLLAPAQLIQKCCKLAAAIAGGRNQLISANTVRNKIFFSLNILNMYIFPYFFN